MDKVCGGLCLFPDRNGRRRVVLSAPCVVLFTQWHGSVCVTRILPHERHGRCVKAEVSRTHRLFMGDLFAFAVLRAA